MPIPTHYPPVLEELIFALRRLPGIGSRTAERLALAMTAWSAEELQQFGTLVSTLKSRLRACEVCGNLTEAPRCRICENPNRQSDVICVVEQASQIPVIEKSGCFRGLYHVLGGRIDPLADKGPDTLRLAELRTRLESGGVRELILATNPDVEGEATAAYLAEEYGKLGVAITRIAAGVPVGSDLGFADSATIAVALNARHRMNG
jgi:recombination protein RecR